MGTICGYTHGDPNQPFTCGTGSTCGYESLGRRFGCTDAVNNEFYSTCVNAGDQTLFAGTLSCDATSPYCGKISLVYTSSLTLIQYQCFDKPEQSGTIIWTPTPTGGKAIATSAQAGGSMALPTSSGSSGPSDSSISSSGGGSTISSSSSGNGLSSGAIISIVASLCFTALLLLGLFRFIRYRRRQNTPKTWQSPWPQQHSGHSVSYDGSQSSGHSFGTGNVSGGNVHYGDIYYNRQ